MTSLATFDFKRASSIPYMVPYKPDPVPGYMWDPRGFWLSMAGTDQIDTSHSLNYVWMEGGRSTCSPSRSQGGNNLAYQFNSLAGWSLVQTGSASAHLAVAGDGFPTLIGKALALSTNGTQGSVAGAQTTLPTVANSFSFATILYAPSTDPADALHYMVQNTNGLVLWVRFYNGVAEVWADGAWHNIGSIGFGASGPQLAEAWVECHDNGNGTRTVKLYGGCQLYGQYTGTSFPGSQLPANNMCTVLQQSGANPNRMGMALTYFVGPTQLPDDMTYCTPVFATGASPTNGHAVLLFEDVSRDLVLGCNIHVFMTKENIGSWIEVPMIDAGVVGKGQIDATADVRRAVGDVVFPAGSGTGIRACVASNSGAFPVLKGITGMWD